MIAISPELKKAFNPNNGQGGRFVLYEITLEIMNNEAQDVSRVIANEDLEISRNHQANDRDPAVIDMITFEHDGFRLDGSQVIPPRPNEVLYAQVGMLLNDISDENGYYAMPQIITAITPDPYSFVATTINWGFAPARDFIVEWHGLDGLIKRKNFKDNSSHLILINEATEQVNKVIITVTRGLLPYHRVRLAELTLGAIKVYERSNTESLYIEEILDPFNATIPSNSLRIIADNFARDFDILDPIGIYEFFRGKRLITVRIGAQMADGEVAYVDMGTYYTQAPSLKGNASRMELAAVNQIGILQATTYTKGIFRSGSLASFVDEVAKDASVYVEYPQRFHDIWLTAYLPSTPHAEAFRMCAQAGNTLLRVNRRNLLIFFDAATIAMQTIDDRDYNQSDGFTPSDDEIFNAVTIPVYNLAPNEEEEELARIPTAATEIFTANHYADNAVIETNIGIVHIMHDPAIDATALIENSELVVRGKKITESKANLQLTETLLPGENIYAYAMSDNMLVQQTNAQSVAEHQLRLKATKRRKVEIAYRGYPYLELGDGIDYVTTGSETHSQPFFITRNTLRLAGGMSGTMGSRER